MTGEIKSETIQVRVTPRLGAAFRARAAEEGRRVSEWMRELARREVTANRHGQDAHPAPKPPVKEKSPRKPVRRRNVVRRRAEWLRAYGSEDRVRFINSLRCIADNGYCGDIENAHVGRNSGAGRKGDADKIVPLCQYHHWCLHNFGREAFEWVHGNLEKSAKETEKIWQRHLLESGK